MLCLTTLGRLELTGPDGSPQPIRRKDFAFLVYLALRAPRRVTRAEACALFWGDRPSRAARLSLRQTVWRLRRELHDVVQASDDEIWLGVATTVDAMEVERDAAAGAYDRVVARAQGEFLTGADDVGSAEFEHWVDETRARMKVCLALSLQRLVQDAFARGQLGVAHTHAQHWIELEPLNETAALECARSLRALGRGAEAMVALNTFCERLTDAGARPSFELRRVQKETRTDVVSRQRSNVTHITELLALCEQARAGGSFVGHVVGEHRDAAIDCMLDTLRTNGGGALLLHGRDIGEILGPLRRARGLTGASTPALAALAAIVPELRADFGRGVIADLPAPERAACEVIDAVAEETAVVLVIRDAETTDIQVRALVAAIAESHIPRVLILACASEPVAWLGEAGHVLEPQPITARRSRLARVMTPVMLMALLSAVLGSYPVRISAVPADAGTTSVAAYRFYQEGLRKYYGHDRASAATLFHAAFREDSTFAMAMYYAHLVELWGDTKNEQLAVAHRLARRAPERDRLKIDAAWSVYTSDDKLRAIAETLSVRYPQEPDGPFYLGHVNWDAGRYAEAIPYYERTIALDTAGFRGHADKCRACEAMERLTGMYRDLDALAEAERFARHWVRLQPRSVAAWDNLGGTIEYTGRLDEALSAYEHAESIDPLVYDVTSHRIELALRRGDFTSADSMVANMVASEDHITMGDGLIFRTLSMRMQGRFDEAVESWNRYRTGWREPRDRITNGSGTARVLLEAGDHHGALAILDSVADVYLQHAAPEHQRHLATVYVTVAAIRFAMRDTAALGELEAATKKWGSLDRSARYGTLHHYVHGLRQRARGDLGGAAVSFQTARLSPTNGNVRASYALAESLLRAGRPAEGIPVLQAAIRGALGSSGSAVTKTELHALLGEAFEAAAQPDSAIVHYGWTVRAWDRADAELLARRSSYERRISALRH